MVMVSKAVLAMQTATYVIRTASGRNIQQLKSAHHVANKKYPPGKLKQVVVILHAFENGQNKAFYLPFLYLNIFFLVYHFEHF